MNYKLSIPAALFFTGFLYAFFTDKSALTILFFAFTGAMAGFVLTDFTAKNHEIKNL